MMIERAGPPTPATRAPRGRTAFSRTRVSPRSPAAPGASARHWGALAATAKLFFLVHAVAPAVERQLALLPDGASVVAPEKTIYVVC
eukprot:2238490-Pyramimonas_sp.AAC.1